MRSLSLVMFCAREEAAATLGISTATAERYWAYARAWLQNEIAAALEA